MIVLAKPLEPPGPLEPVPLDLIHIRDGPEGRYARHRDIGGDVPVVILPGAPIDLAAAALVPFAADSPDRIEAVSRFWRAGRGLEAPDTRLTPRQRQRIPRALRVADAQSQGASYRDIAEALRGITRLGEEIDWRSSPLRTEAIQLLKLGLSLIEGGYLDLLHHRRRP